MVVGPPCVLVEVPELWQIQSCTSAEDRQNNLSCPQSIIRPRFESVIERSPPHPRHRAGFGEPGLSASKRGRGWLTGFKPVAPGSLGSLIWILRSPSQALKLSETLYLYIDNDYTNQVDILVIRISPRFTYTFKCVIV